MKDLEGSPWDMIMDNFSEGQLTEGTVTKLTKFGAFASISGLADYDIEGLIHISELSDKHIEHPREVVKEGQTLTLRIVKLDVDRRRIGLSLKAVDSPAYAEQDIEAAMSDVGEEVSEPPPIEDFDAALEAETVGDFLGENPEEALGEDLESEAFAEEVETEAEETEASQEVAAEEATEESIEESVAEEEIASPPTEDLVSSEQSTDETIEVEEDEGTPVSSEMSGEEAEIPISEQPVTEDEEGSPPLEPDESQEAIE
jgi:ribosomal protein S1